MGLGRENLRMQAARQVFDRGNYARGRAVDGIADRLETTVANRIKPAPAGPIREKIEIILRGIRVRRGKDEKVGLQLDNLLEIHLWPVLRGLNDGCRSGVPKCVSNKRVLTDGD